MRKSSEGEPPAESSAAAGDPTDARSADTAGQPPRRRSRRRRGLLVLAVVAVGVAAWAVVATALAAHRLAVVQHDVAQLDAAGAGGDRQRLELRLSHDRNVLVGAERLLGQPGPRLVGAVPVVGRNIRAAQAVAHASRATVVAALTVLRSTEHLGNGHGGVNLSALMTTSSALDQQARALRQPLQDLMRVKVGLTLPSVGDGVRKARNRLLGLDAQLAQAAAGARGVADVLGGQGRRTFLVGLTNNAELRGTQGLLAAYAVGDATDGVMHLGPFRNAAELSRPPTAARRVPAPPDYHHDYGPYLADTTLWKNVTMSPEGNETAQVVAAEAAVSLHLHPDVVVLMDVPATSAIVSATGPVRVDGALVSGGELTRRLLVDAYGSGTLSRSEQQRRHEVLDSAASDAFDRLRQEGNFSSALLRALARAASGRHLVLWSARPDEERALVDAGVAGVVEPAGRDLLMVTGNNLGDPPAFGNKLDYYVSRQISMDVGLRPGTADVTETITLDNSAPANLGPYVLGIHHPGVLTELLMISTAADAEVTSFTENGQSVPVEVDAGAGARRLTFTARLPSGSTSVYRVTYRLRLGSSPYRLLMVPQALARPADLRLRVHALSGTLGVTSGVPQPQDGAVTVSGPWTSTRSVSVPISPLRGVRAVLHAVAHFWTHRVSL